MLSHALFSRICFGITFPWIFVSRILVPGRFVPWILIFLGYLESLKARAGGSVAPKDTFLTCGVGASLSLVPPCALTANTAPRSSRLPQRRNQQRRSVRGRGRFWGCGGAGGGGRPGRHPRVLARLASGPRGCRPGPPPAPPPAVPTARDVPVCEPPRSAVK